MGATPENVEKLIAEKDSLSEELKSLQKEIYKLRLEKDLLENAAELIKKEEGISLKTLNNREKAVLINALRNTYPLKDLLETLNMPKSSYFYQKEALNKGDKYKGIKLLIKEMFDSNYQCYGYRRIHCSLVNRGIKISEKVVRRLMKIEQLVVRIPKRAKYNAFKGDISPEAPNLLKRDFNTDEPNTKWVTDITEFGIPAGKLYLSPMLDCFDGLMGVRYNIG